MGEHRRPALPGGIMAIARTGDHDGAVSYDEPPPSDVPPSGGPPPEGPPPGAPPPSGPPPQGPPPGQPYAGGYAGPPPQPVGVVPQTVGGPYNSPWLVVLLMIVTCGIWGIFWTYRTSEDLKKYNGDGLGGVLGIVIYLLLSVVLMFTIPGEIEKMYQRDGRQSPVSPLWGLWFLLPIVGLFIWYFKVQNALNEFWLAKGARAD